MKEGEREPPPEARTIEKSMPGGKGGSMESCTDSEAPIIGAGDATEKEEKSESQGKQDSPSGITPPEYVTPPRPETSIIPQLLKQQRM